MVDVFAFPSRTTLTEDVIQHIISAIRDGDLQSGEKLPSERELSQELDVSRSCVREALQALAMLRLIDIKSGRGAYVRNIQPEDVIDTNVLSELIQGDSLVALVETRIILEVEIARLAAERRTEEQLQEIAKIFEALDTRHLTVSQILEYDIEFHMLLSEATNNPVLFKLYQSIFALLADSRKKVNLIPGARNKSWVYHRAIYEAVMRKDGVAAKKAMTEHLEDVWTDINKYLLGGRESNHQSYKDMSPHVSSEV
jgi:GntR family transcriptional regulator, transcriptional repressor for pyruvate dehydrogenase complex